ncbi:CYTH domain-containing protein [Microbacterium dauci]|uniref:CYTH domain-containing protein n=1 Tax=Microbacterium dauci TaxID=3048008 RepID=A0ABT6ZG31_9MICO|nr:CYTH domain-containing protein [Microbacterium sp. LX3-4]MDJ1115120.1 CYTH domain-containing protein [Microbacterium sp. LX3-4]
MTSDAEHSLEIERKYDVDAETPLPDWTELPGVDAVGAPEPRQLDARYLDSADGALGRARIALRRRTGGPDEGWHVKRVTPDGKAETRWPLDGDGSSDTIVVPDAVAAAVAEIAAPPFTVLARIRNNRTAYALRSAAGAVVAEFVDDRVDATDERTGRSTTWREWELELGPAAPPDESAREELFARAEDLVRRAGGVPAASESKLGRALGA